MRARRTLVPVAAAISTAPRLLVRRPLAAISTVPAGWMLDRFPSRIRTRPVTSRAVREAELAELLRAWSRCREQLRFRALARVWVALTRRGF